MKSQLSNQEQKPKFPVQSEYSELAAVYDKKWRNYLNFSINKIMNRIKYTSTHRLLDIGCGTGLLLETLRRNNPGISLTGIDITAEMLEIAAKRLPASVNLKQAKAEALPFPDSTFDTVVLSSMLHYVRHPKQAIREAGRVMRNGGNLIITDWCSDFIPCKIYNGYMQLFNKAHFQTYGSFQCMDLIIGGGFKIVSFEKYKLNWFWGLMTISAMK